MQPVLTPPVSSLAAITQTVVTNLVPLDVTVANTPPNVNQLLRTVQISGTVAAAPDNGSVTLTTALGNFTLSLGQLPDATRQQMIQQLENLFQSQKPLTAVIQPGSPPTQAVLLIPLPAGGAQVSTAAQAAVPVANPAAQNLSLSPGMSLTAVVLPSDIVVPGAGNAASNSAVPAVAAQAVEAETVTPNATGQTPAPQNTTPNPVAPNPVLQPGKEVAVHVDAVALPSSPVPEPAGNQVGATVIGNGANGQLILKTSDNTMLYVRAAAAAPVGTSLLIRIEAPKMPAPTVLPAVAEQNFTSLQQTLDAVAQINPQLAQQILQARVPQPNAQLTGPLLFFLSALKQGDAKGWLGNDVAEMLGRAGKLELLAKLGQSMNESMQTAHDPAVGEWKSYPVPLHTNGQFQALHLHVHADGHNKPQDGEPGRGAQHVRFLIDVRMSRFGPMQLDGLVRPKKLDMIVRSESALPAGLPQELRNSYLATMGALGYTGGLSFQTGKQHWLVPHQEKPQSFIT